MVEGSHQRLDLFPLVEDLELGLLFIRDGIIQIRLEVVPIHVSETLMTILIVIFLPYNVLYINLKHTYILL